MITSTNYCREVKHHALKTILKKKKTIFFYVLSFIFEPRSTNPFYLFMWIFAFTFFLTGKCARNFYFFMHLFEYIFAVYT